MSKVKEYLKNKRIMEMGFPKIYVVHSTPVGVSMTEHQITEIKENYSIINYSNRKVNTTLYKKEDCFPFEIVIEDGLKSSKEEGHGSGFGDLWAWTYYSFLDKDDADAYYIKESERVTNKYHS